MVVLFHLHTTGNITNFPIVANGWLFVDFFFVLSGFVIAAAYFRRIADGFSTWRFMGLRLGRTYPLHLFMLALFLAMEFTLAHVGSGGMASRGAFGAGRSPPEFAAAFTYFNAFGLFDRLGPNGPSWSIGAEFWVYILFAVFVGCGRRYAVVLFAVAGLGALAWLIVASPDALGTTYQYGAIRCVYGFSVGVLLERWLARRGGRVRSMIGGGTIAELAVATLAICFVWFARDGVTFFAPVVFALMITVFAFERGRLSAVLKCRPMLALGTLSYSIYLTHAFVEGRFANVGKIVGHRLGHQWVTTDAQGSSVLTMPPLFADASAIVLLLLTIGFSWFTYRLVELPGRTLTRRWVSGARDKNAIRAEAQSPTF